MKGSTSRKLFVKVKSSVAKETRMVAWIVSALFTINVDASGDRWFESAWMQNHLKIFSLNKKERDVYVVEVHQGCVLWGHGLSNIINTLLSVSCVQYSESCVQYTKMIIKTVNC